MSNPVIDQKKMQDKNVNVPKKAASEPLKKPPPQQSTAKHQTTQMSDQDTRLMSTVVRYDYSPDTSTTVHFLNETQVTQHDSFSASWLMGKQDFLDMNLDPINMCEDAAFKAWNNRRNKLRMTLDYFDWSVEHLSKWWKVMDYDYKHAAIWDNVISKLGAYVRSGATDYPAPSSEPPVLHETIATIAFRPYKVSKGAKRGKPNPLPDERAYNLTIHSLAATIESLRRAEMGRVLVVGIGEEDEQYTLDTIRFLRENLKIPHPGASNRVGHLEVAYVSTDLEAARTKIMKFNMPKACLVGARKSFLAIDSPDRTTEQTEHMEAWFGTSHDPQHWKMLYLTEPDSLLTTRAASLPQIKDEIHRGGIVVPFRLQPMPHESDVQGFPLETLYLHEDDGFPVQELDHYAEKHDVCCDAHLGPNKRPGKAEFPPCGNRKWFLCGIDDKFRDVEDPHYRLRQYQLFRLKRGSGITTIAGNLFARRCFPGQDAVCKPPHVY